MRILKTTSVCRIWFSNTVVENNPKNIASIKIVGKWLGNKVRSQRSATSNCTSAQLNSSSDYTGKTSERDHWQFCFRLFQLCAAPGGSVNTRDCGYDSDDEPTSLIGKVIS
jgi:hypothetical protein